MATESSITPETILRISQEVLGTPISPEDAQTLAHLLNGLAAETSAMQAMDLADAEPVTLYEARP